MPDHIDKAELRRRIRTLTRAIPEAELTALSRDLTERLARHPRLVAARTVLLFHSLPDEPCTHTLLDDLAAQKVLLLPVVSGDHLLIRRYRPEQMREGAFHISEPAGRDFTDFAAIDLAIIPGMAFTPDGRRMGRGRGYYDRLLSRPDMAGTYRLGICFPHQLLSELPTEPHDVRMDEVLTAAAAGPSLCPPLQR